MAGSEKEEEKRRKNGSINNNNSKNSVPPPSRFSRYDGIIVLMKNNGRQKHTLLTNEGDPVPRCFSSSWTSTNTLMAVGHFPRIVFFSPLFFLLFALSLRNFSIRFLSPHQLIVAWFYGWLSMWKTRRW